MPVCFPMSCTFCGGCYIPQRAIVVFMVFYGLINMYIMRVALNVAIINMINYNIGNKTTISGKCELPNTYNFNQDQGHRVLVGAFQRGQVLAAFYYGYCLAQIPVLFVQNFNGRALLAFFVFCQSLFFALIPPMVEMASWYMAIVMRFLQGFSAGFILPLVCTYLQKWIPIRHREFVSTFMFSASNVGNIIGMACTPVIITKLGKWYYMFYFFGGISLAWTFVFLVSCYESYSIHPFITPQEFMFLKNNIGENPAQKTPPMPVGKIFGTASVWAVIFASMAHDFNFYLLLIHLPIFYYDLMRLDETWIIIGCVLPFCCLWISAVLFGFLSRCVIRCDCMSIANVRRLFTTIGLILPPVFLVLTGIQKCDKIVTIALFCCGMLFMGSYYSGAPLTVIDIAPTFATSICPIVNVVGVSMGFVAPLIVTFVSPDFTYKQWCLLTYITAGFCGFCSFLYLVLVSGKRQYWDMD